MELTVQREMKMDDDLSKLHDMLQKFLAEANENLGSERVQPYVHILEGVLKGICTDLNSD